MSDFIEAISNHLSETRVPIYLAKTTYRRSAQQMERLDQQLRTFLTLEQQPVLDAFISAHCSSSACELDAMCWAAFSAAELLR